MHGSADRQIGIRDQLQAFERKPAIGRRATRHDPAELHLRQAHHFGEPAEAKCQDFLDACQGAHQARVVPKRIVRENFVGNESQVVFAAQIKERAELGLLEERSGRIVRVHQHDGPRAGWMELASASKSMLHAPW